MEATLEEYSKLREELLFQKESRERSLYAAGILLALAIPYLDVNGGAGRTINSLKLVSFECPAIALGLLLCLVLHVHTMYSICRISTYIECVTEAKLGTSWVSSHRTNNIKLGIALRPSAFRAMVGIYFTACLTSVWALYISIDQYHWLSFTMLLAFSLCYIVLLASVFSYESNRAKIKKALESSKR